MPNFHYCDLPAFCRLAPWECAILNEKPRARAHDEGEGDVTFTRTDGRTVTFKNVEVDSVSPAAVTAGTVAFNYFGTDKIVHVPFVESWEFTYNF